jgi:tripartite-type tricarboxylate transporter receptor subunit TctC
MKRLLTVLFAGVALALSAGAVSAQTWPTKPVRVIVPFAPGGPADQLGRLAAQIITDSFGQPGVVENKVGAAGNIGVDLIAKAPADGYTLGLVPVGNVVVNPALFPNLPYAAKELTPVSMLATVENVLVVHAGVSATNLRDLLAQARQKPEGLSFASPGAGSQAHLAGELLSLESNVKLVHVPYKGIGPAMNDLLGGQVTMMFAATSAAIPHIQSGKLRAIGVASLKKSAALPQVPTIAEQGLPGFEAVSWYALMAPAATSREVVDKLHAEIGRVLARSDTRERFATQGMEAGTGTPQQIAARITAESARWSEVVKKRNLKPD